MLIIVTEDIYNQILAAYGEDYVGIDDEGNFGIYMDELINADLAYEADGGYYLVSLKPSEKDIWVGSGL